MSNKIMRAGSSDRKLEKFRTERYSRVELGQSDFSFEVFTKDNQSVQDMIGQELKPNINNKKTPSFVPVSASTYGDLNDEKNRERFFNDMLNPKPKISKNRFSDEFVDDDYDKEETEHAHEFAEIDLTQTPDISGEAVTPESQKKKLEDNAQLKALEDDVAALTAERNTLKLQINELQVQLQEANINIKELEAAAPVIKEEGKQEGYEIAKTEFNDKELKQYEVQKQDYFSILEKNWIEAHEEIQKIKDTISEIDTQIPEIVIGYVRQLIGAERKFNDKMITGVVSAAMENLKDLQQVVFTVNPDDASTIAEKFSQYGVAIDPSIPKGGVKIRTKVGDIELNVDSWIDNLERQINEQLAASKNNKSS